MPPPVSPLAPPGFADLPQIDGVKFATAEAGITYSNRTDVLFVTCAPGTSVAGVFTRSKCPSAAVDWCRAHLGNGRARALLVNSGNANAFTGLKGRHAVERSAELAAKAAGCPVDEVFLASTGVIGEPLDPERFDGVLSQMSARLGADSSRESDSWRDAAEAIMTTDTFAKGATAPIDMNGARARVVGIAKGSGMIAPDMATMLAFLFTDLEVSPLVLQAALNDQVKTSFNAITVDSDTSTSDTVLLFATGRASRRGLAPLSKTSDPGYAIFSKAIGQVMFDLAMQVVRDGEGATKLVSIAVTGAVSDQSAAVVAKSVANSPLVKTAIAGEDANWGRVVMAVGKAGEPADRDRLAIWFGSLAVAKDGERAPGHDETATSAYMKGTEISIAIDLGLGQGKFTAYTCDLTHGYIDINASYRS
ncbi:MAG: bifunctional glutamate N-acetyltransferase/amino-acid acetyltransferase ArgJ [Alphaproteobacteria bacterium]|nr:bifunctional glutamate N-acetyltransferase/amino-acid acetyltransferase ArgJ [Alphaproteobacteria bacterium]